MSVTSGFFDSLNHDRKYNALQMTSIFDGIIRDGVFMSITDKLMVDAESGMTVIVKPGRAWFNHTWTLNDAKLPLDVEQSELILDRIDAVVLEVNSQLATRNNSIKIVKGTPASEPKKPTLTKSLDLNQYPLAYITVTHGVTKIEQANIENTVGTSECPFVTGILETISIDDLVAQWKSEWEVWITQMKTDGEAWQAEYEASFEEWSEQQRTEFTQFMEQFEATMQIFQTNSEDAFNAWFETVKDVLGDDVAGNLLNLINEIKDGNPNATATYRNGVVAIVTDPVTAKNIYFYAPSNFIESDTYTLNGIPITIKDLNGEPIYNAWKAGSPVSLIIKGNVGFFKSGGGGGRNDTLPPMVTNLAALPGNEKITVSWKNPISDALDGVAVTYNKDHYPQHPYDGTKIDAKKNEQTVIGFLTNGTEYFVRIFPYNAKKQYQTLEEGSMVSATPSSGPLQVSNFKIEGTGVSISLSWENPEDPTYHETVVVQKEGSQPTTVDDGTEIYRGTGTNTTASELKGNIQYYFGVFTFNDAGGTRGPVVEMYEIKKPQPVTNLQVTGTGGTPVITWTNPVDEWYRETVVVRKEWSSPTATTDGTSVYRGSGETVTDSGLQPFTDYYYSVFTLNEVDESSDPISIGPYRFEFPNPPESWSEVTTLTGNGKWTPPEIGYFLVCCLGRSGSGGERYSYKTTSDSYALYPGGSGGTGSYCEAIIKVETINEYTYSVDSSKTKFELGDLFLLANGGTDAKDSEHGSTFNGSPGIASSSIPEAFKQNGKYGDYPEPEWSYIDSGEIVRGAGSVVSTYTSSNNPGVSFTTRSGAGGGSDWSDEGRHPDPIEPGTGTNGKIVIYRGNTNSPSPSKANTMLLIPTDGKMDVRWDNSGDSIQIGNTLVYNNDHIPTSPNDGISVDISVGDKTIVRALLNDVDSAANNEINEQSYLIEGLDNDKPLYVSLFPYDKDKNYGFPRSDVEIPRKNSWYENEIKTKNELIETTERADKAESIVDISKDYLPDSVAFTLTYIYDEWNPNGFYYIGKDKATEDEPAAIVRRNGKLYRCIQSHESQENWKPETSPSLWVEISDPGIEWPEWKQPTNAEDAYNTGDKVTYNGKKYISKINANTTVPGSDPRWWEEVE